MALEREVFLLGIWKNFDEIEENLTLAELQEVLNATRDKEQRERKFLAAIQGIDIDKGKNESDDFERVKLRAQARANGLDPEALELASMGIKVVDDWTGD